LPACGLFWAERTAVAWLARAARVP
jgi:hypothetical protein